ncbi:uncharacterized protein [Littorina saxatilis]|uniref:Uncharacterized protein n=1 Tax=Littorina saxatilis TaxID=31220 RepID=A0AAN9AZG9_9CAEN
MAMKLMVLLLIAVCAVSRTAALTVTEEDDINTAYGKVHEVVQSDLGCNLKVNNATMPNGTISTVVEDFVAKMVLTTSSASDAVCYVREMTSAEKDDQQGCQGEVVESEDDPTESVDTTYEELENTLSLDALPDTMKQYCQGKEIIQLVPEGSQVDGINRKKRDTCRIRCQYTRYCGSVIYCNRITRKCYRYCVTYYYNCRRVC